MNLHSISQATKLDLVSGLGAIICLAIMLIAAELAAPLLAGFGAIVGTVTGVTRLYYSYQDKSGS